MLRIFCVAWGYVYTAKENLWSHVSELWSIDSGSEDAGCGSKNSSVDTPSYAVVQALKHSEGAEYWSLGFRPIGSIFIAIFSPTAWAHQAWVSRHGLRLSVAGFSFQCRHPLRL